MHEKQTTPPPRYDQGALIKKLETSGIGRPATFASIIDTLLKRDYVRELEAAAGKKFLQPTEFGLQVDGLMSHAFPELVTEGYTAEMEAQLDAIEGGAATRPATCATGTRASAPPWRARALARRRVPRGARPARGVPAGGGAAEETTTTLRPLRRGDLPEDRAQGRQGQLPRLPGCRMTRDVRAKVRAGACPVCESSLIEKKIGKLAPFWGCVRYGADTRPCTLRASARRGGRRGTDRRGGREARTRHEDHQIAEGGAGRAARDRARAVRAHGVDAPGDRPPLPRLRRAPRSRSACRRTPTAGAPRTPARTRAAASRCPSARGAGGSRARLRRRHARAPRRIGRAALALRPVALRPYGAVERRGLTPRPHSPSSAPCACS